MGQKLYLAVDEWQYDGGMDILGIYTAFVYAAERVTIERLKYANLKIYTPHRLLAIKVVEKEVER